MYFLYFWLVIYFIKLNIGSRYDKKFSSRGKNVFYMFYLLSLLTKIILDCWHDICNATISLLLNIFCLIENQILLMLMFIDFLKETICLSWMLCDSFITFYTKCHLPEYSLIMHQIRYTSNMSSVHVTLIKHNVMIMTLIKDIIPMTFIKYNGITFL